MTALIASLRPKQWTKNLLLFAGYLFTIEQEHPSFTWLRVLAAFALFCTASGAGYLLNDVVDVERDRKHPHKSTRPVASGRLSCRAAIVFSAALAAVTLGASFLLDEYFGVCTAAYLALTTAYSLLLKHVVILDLMGVAAGFVLRAVAGTMVVESVDPTTGLAHRVEVSPWLLVCTTLLALFLGSAKRRAELLEENGVEHRPTLEHYTAPLLDQILSISASACLMAYFLYTFGSKTGETTHHQIMITIPFVIYGLFRYLYLIHVKMSGANPEQLLIDDKPLLANVVLYVVAAILAMKL